MGIRISNRYPRRRHHRGFTLIEVLVAFLVLALSLGVLMQIFSLAMRTTSTAGDYQRALLLAESLMAEISAEPVLTPGRRSGWIDERFQWRSRIESFETDFDPPLQEEPIPVVPYEIHIEVAWSETQSVDLTTIRLAQEP